MHAKSREEGTVNYQQQTAGNQKWQLPVLLLVTAAVYARALTNGFTSYDDDLYILHNPHLTNAGINGIMEIFTNFYNANYHPLTTLLWRALYYFLGATPLPYHLVNVLLHIANTWLAFTVAYQLSKQHQTGWIVAAVFALHPMHVESVAWVSELKDVLFAFFYLLSLITYLRYQGQSKNKKWYAATLLLFLAALLSKPAAVTLPVLLLAVDWYRNPASLKKQMANKIPFFLLAALFGVLAVLSQKAGGALHDATGDVGILNRITFAAAGLCIYVFRFFIPAGLSAAHYFPYLQDGLLPWHYYLSLLVVPTTFYFVYRKGGREVIFGLAFFVITISVMLQLVGIGATLTAERYTYIPYIGLAYIVGQWFAGQPATKYQLATTVTLVLVFALFAGASWQRIAVWNDENLWTDILENNADAKHLAPIYTTKGKIAAGRGDAAAAIADFSRALQLDPSLTRTYSNRASAYASMGNYPAALADYNAYLQRKTDDPLAYTGRGMVYISTGDTTAACADWAKAASMGDQTAGQLMQGYCGSDR